MESLKNMIVLKGLPSNLIEEAILILKPNCKSGLEPVEYFGEDFSEEFDIEDKDYIVKEAKLLLAMFLEKNEYEKINAKKMKRINRRLKLICITLLLFNLISIIFLAF